MTQLRVVSLLGFGLAAVCCLSSTPRLAASAPGDPPESDGRPASRVYTNEDLDRVRPFRAETGALSQPARIEVPRAPREGRRDPRAGRGEEYWRREAAKVRERTRSLAEQAEALRARIAEHADEARRGTRRSRASSSRAAEARLRARISVLERRLRQLEDDLADRARRGHALPGWLR